MSKTIQTPPDKLDFALFRDAVDKQIQAAIESQKALLKQALASKKVDEINSLSVEEIEKRLASM